MDNIRATIKTLFSQINSSYVIHQLLQGKSCPENLGIDEQMFCQRFMIENKCYTTDQVCELYQLFMDKWTLSPTDVSNGRYKNLFHILLNFTHEVLTEKNDAPICHYNQLLRWRFLTHYLSEDLFTTAFLAHRDLCLKHSRESFCWDTTIGQDNANVNYILHKGVTDLHFHLKGSSLNYELNWICLMNHINNRSHEFEELKNCLGHITSTTDGEKWDNSYVTTAKACAIRCYLFMRLTDTAKDFPPDRLHHILQSNDSTDISRKINRIVGTRRKVESFRYGRNDLVGEALLLDYAISIPYKSNIGNQAAFILSGERELMYRMFRRIFNNEATHEETVLFYIYLIQKTHIRKELIQLNEQEGFRNFADYESRKELFLRNHAQYRQMVIPLAIHTAFANRNLKYLECRITPRNDAAELISTIRQNDTLIEKTAPHTYKNITNHFFYILHFIKQKDIYDQRNINILGRTSYRHHQLRSEIKKQGYAIMQALRSNVKHRIAGVDAANSELYCRPEVFGPVFRYLKENNRCGLGFTFHVGEDFWDIADGLRAIDEAVLFLNLNGNDRLGHALALGINVKHYYKFRNNRIVMTKQNWMDNAMWLSFKARELGIHIPTNTELELITTFRHFYDEIYLNSRNDKQAEKELMKGRDIDVYHQSWLIRGDDPEYYRSNMEHLINLTDTQEIQSDWYHTAILRNNIVNEARKHKIAFRLYQLYHYDAEVRRIGNQRHEKVISTGLINLIEQIQEGMKRQIAHRHLSIEANITSNMFIGKISKYMQHPIVNFYKKGLYEENENPYSISVSINTDDKGIFNTSIEEEYALVALALEKEKKETDENMHRHSSWNVYDWLDSIRIQGWTQCFRHNAYSNNQE